MNHINRKKDILNNAARRGRSIIHFSNLENKLGINPKTKYKTPAGVYGYILNKKSLSCLIDPNKTDVEYSEDLYKRCDLSTFAIRRDYVYVAEFKQSDKLAVKINKNGYSNLSENVIKDMYKKLYSLYNSDCGKLLIKSRSNKESNDYYFDMLCEESRIGSRFKTPFGEFWNTTRNFSRNPIAWGSLLYELGIGAVFDYGSGIIHPSEKSQAVILETHNINVLYHGENPLVEKEEDGIFVRRRLAFKNLMSDVRKFKFFEGFDGSSKIYTRNESIDLGGPESIIEIKKSLFSCVQNPSMTFFVVSLLDKNSVLARHLPKDFIIVSDKKSKKTYISIARSIADLSLSTDVFKFYWNGRGHDVPNITTDAIDFNFSGKVDFIIESNEEMNILIIDFLSELDRSVVFHNKELDKINKFIVDFNRRYYLNHIDEEYRDEADRFIEENHLKYSEISTRTYKFEVIDEINNIKFDTEDGEIYFPFTNYIYLSINILGMVSVGQRVEYPFGFLKDITIIREKNIFISKNPYLRLKKIISGIIDISRDEIYKIKEVKYIYDPSSLYIEMKEKMSGIKGKVIEFLDLNNEGPTIIDMNYEDIE